MAPYRSMTDEGVRVASQRRFPGVVLHVHQKPLGKEHQEFEEYDIEFDMNELGWCSEDEIKDDCQSLIKERFDLGLDFEVDDALRKLCTEQVVEARTGSRGEEFKAKAIEEAIWAIGRDKYYTGDAAAAEEQLADQPSSRR